MNTTTTRFCNALIRTHHITSRRKITKLKQAASGNEVFVLIRTGGSPGIMYVEGGRDGVQQWIDVVHKLRYKDYQLAARPSAVLEPPHKLITPGNLAEVSTVKDFAENMQQRGILNWWRAAMGYDQPQSS